jgi:hypothetical protein
VEDIKEDLMREHGSIHWVPETARNAFNAWLENLRDNSVSKQRFWYEVQSSSNDWLTSLHSTGAHRCQFGAMSMTRVITL